MVVLIHELQLLALYLLREFSQLRQAVSNEHEVAAEQFKDARRNAELLLTGLNHSDN